MMGTEIFKIDASWAEKLTKTRVSFLMTHTVDKMLPETDGYKVLRQKKPTMSSVSLKCKLDMGRANVGSAGLDVGNFQRVSFLLQTSLII